MSLIHKITTKEASSKKYHTIGIHREEDLDLKFDLSSDPSWKNLTYYLSIYKQNDYSIVDTKEITSDVFTMTIPNWDYGAFKGVIVVEDRSDLNNVNIIATIGYLNIREFKGGAKRVKKGDAIIEEFDGSTVNIPYYTTELIDQTIELGDKEGFSGTITFG